MNQNVYNMLVRDRRFYRGYSLMTLFILALISPELSLDRVIWALCMVGILLDILHTNSMEKDYIKYEALLNESTDGQVDNG